MIKNRKISLSCFCLLISIFTILSISQEAFQKSAEAVNSDRLVPRFEVDPYWPQPLPNKWIMGRTIGIAIDERDHLFIVHRDQDSMFMSQELGLDLGRAECCTAAPPILEFDSAGNLISAWGGPGEGYTWPESNHGIEVGADGNVWIGGNGSGDSHVLVFTRDGQFVREIGLPGELSLIHI